MSASEYDEHSILMLKFKEPKTIILMNKAFVNFFLHDAIRNGEGRPKDLFAAPLSLRLRFSEGCKGQPFFRFGAGRAGSKILGAGRVTS